MSPRERSAPTQRRARERAGESGAALGERSSREGEFRLRQGYGGHRRSLSAGVPRGEAPRLRSDHLLERPAARARHLGAASELARRGPGADRPRSATRRSASRSGATSTAWFMNALRMPSAVACSAKRSYARPTSIQFARGRSGPRRRSRPRPSCAGAARSFRSPSAGSAGRAGAGGPASARTEDAPVAAVESPSPVRAASASLKRIHVASSSTNAESRIWAAVPWATHSTTVSMIRSLGQDDRVDARPSAARSSSCRSAAEICCPS